MNRNTKAPQLPDSDLLLLSQYLDGELPAADSHLLEGRLHGDRSLQSALARMQELNQRLRDALYAHNTIPEHVSRLLTEHVDAQSPSGSPAVGSARVLQFPGRPAAKTKRLNPWAYAIAASLVGAVAISLISDIYDAPRSVLAGGDALVSAALDRHAGGSGWYSLDDGRDIQPVLTFPHADGRWCREFLVRGGDADLRAVACREDGQWAIQAAGLESFLESADVYRPAGAADAEPVSTFISQHAADIALGADEEQRLINRRWEP